MLETHRIESEAGETKVFKRWNNPNEIMALLIHLVEALALLLLTLVGGRALYVADSFSIPILLLMVLFVLASAWLLYQFLASLFIDFKRLFLPILSIKDSQIRIVSPEGDRLETKLDNIRSVDGKNQLSKTIFLLWLEHPKKSHYVRIGLSTNKGEYLPIDIIQSSKFSGYTEAELKRELKVKSKAFGTLVAERLGVQFFLDSKVYTKE